MFQPFPIADFRTGEFTAREAWLAPADAFSTMQNISIENGVLRKRMGTQIFGYFPTRIGTVTLITASGSGTEVSVQLTSHGLSTNDCVIFQDDSTTTEVNNNKYFITKTDADNFTLNNTDQANFTHGGNDGTVDQLKSLTFVASIAVSGVTQTDRPTVTTDSAHGLSTGDTVLISGDFGNSILGMDSLNNIISTISVLTTTKFQLDEIDATDFDAHTSGGDVAKINTSNSNGIVGLGELFQDDVENKLIAINHKRVAKYNTSKKNFEAIHSADIFTGTNNNPFQMVNAFGYLWMTNFKDEVYQYDNSTLSQSVFDIDGDGGASPTYGSHNDLSYCKFIFPFANRLMILYTVENGTAYPQRVRWSRLAFGAGDTSQWDDTASDTNAGSLDADTNEEIIAFGYLRDAVIVIFERSIWALRKTGSFDLPVRWEKISEAPGVFGSNFGASSQDNFLWCFGAGGTIATDGVQTKRIDDVIPDFEASIRQEDLERIFLSKVIENHQTWLSYGGTSNSQNSNVKVLDYENGTFSDYDLGYNVMGEFNSENLSPVTWSECIGQEWQWENIHQRWKDFASRPGKPRNLIGDESGMVFIINDGYSDCGRKIDVELITSRFNPFKDEGKAARFGYVDFLVTENQSTTMTVEFFTDFDSVPHTTETVSFASDEGVNTREKIYVRVYVDAIGNTHRMRITHSGASELFEIHAIIPYFAPTGRLLNL